MVEIDPAEQGLQLAALVPDTGVYQEILYVLLGEIVFAVHVEPVEQGRGGESRHLAQGLLYYLQFPLQLGCFGDELYHLADGGLGSVLDWSVFLGGRCIEAEVHLFLIGLAEGL